MATGLKSFGLHYIIFMTHLAILTADYAYIVLPTDKVYAGRFKFLTFWSFLIGFAYYNVAAVMDFLAYTRGKESSLWVKISDYIFTTIVFPLAIFVCSMFWILYTANPSFMRDPEVDKIIPKWMNHGYHTVPIMAAFLEAYSIRHVYSRIRAAAVGIFALDSAYTIWLFWIAYRANIWVYPILQRMSLFGVFVFIGVCGLLSLVLYMIGRKFSEFVWQGSKNKSR